MKRMVLCAAAAFVLMTSSGAAEGPPLVRPWTGFYIGAGAGAGAMTQVQSLVDPGFGIIFSQSAGAEGLFGTVAAGYDYRLMQRVVVGGFFDYDFSSISNDTPALFPISIPFDYKHTWSIGGRIGYLVNPTTLWYVLGGYARASFDLDTIGNMDFGGYFVGGGVEAQLVGNWSLRGEYRFTQLQTESVLDLCGCPSELEFETTIHTGRLMLIYRFDNGNTSPALR